MKTLYDVLGVTRDATPAEVKKAFRGIALKCHPDHAGDNPNAARRLEEAKAAFETLGDTDKRRDYDAEIGTVPASLGALLTSPAGLRTLQARFQTPPLAPKPGMHLWAVVQSRKLTPGSDVQVDLLIPVRQKDGSIAERPLVRTLTIPEEWAGQHCLVLESKGGLSRGGHGEDAPDGNLFLFLAEREP